jgi:hypothetical protein
MKKYIAPTLEVIELNTEASVLSVITASEIAVDVDQDATIVRSPERHRGESWSNYDGL